MKLRCKKELRFENGNKQMNFTLNYTYDFTESVDPEGWEVIDDKGNKVVFFNPFIMFETL